MRLVRGQNDGAAARGTVGRRRRRREGEKRPELYATIAGLDRVLVIPETTKYCAFSLCPTGIVFSHMTKLLALGDGASAAIVLSSIHEEIGRAYSSTLETRLKYITSDGLETSSLP